MKKVLLSLFVLVAYVASFAAANSVSVNIDPQQKPSNIAVYKLGTCNGSAADSFTVDGSKVYGPIPLSIDNSRPQFKYFRIYPTLTAFASGDSMKVEYQLLPSNKITDTTSTWVSVSAYFSTGVPTSAIDLTALPGQSIAIKITNIDSTPVTVVNAIRAVFSAPATESSDAKR